MDVYYHICAQIVEQNLHRIKNVNQKKKKKLLRNKFWKENSYCIALVGSLGVSRSSGRTTNRLRNWENLYRQPIRHRGDRKCKKLRKSEFDLKNWNASLELGPMFTTHQPHMRLNAVLLLLTEGVRARSPLPMRMEYIYSLLRRLHRSLSRLGDSRRSRARIWRHTCMHMQAFSWKYFSLPKNPSHHAVKINETKIKWRKIWRKKMAENEMEQFCHRRCRHCRFPAFLLPFLQLHRPSTVAIVGISYSCREASEKCISTYRERMQLGETPMTRVSSSTIYVRFSPADRRQPYIFRVSDHTGHV